MPDTALYGLGIVAVLMGLAISFVRDLRRKRRGEPIRYLGLGEIHPGHPLYESLWLQYITPYCVVFGIAALLLALFLWVTVRSLFGP